MSLPVVKDNRITGRNSKNKSTVKLEVTGETAVEHIIAELVIRWLC